MKEKNKGHMPDKSGLIDAIFPLFLFFDCAFDCTEQEEKLWERLY